MGNWGQQTTPLIGVPFHPIHARQLQTKKALQPFPTPADSPIMNGARKDKLCDLVHAVIPLPGSKSLKIGESSYGKLTIFRGAMSLGIPENPTDIELEQILGIYQVV